MAKAKAPPWLREAFRDGVDERVPPGGVRLAPAYRGAYPNCWLAHHDPRRRPCTGPLERFHFVNRQRVENALGALMPDPGELCTACAGQGVIYGQSISIHWDCEGCGGTGGAAPPDFALADLILIAAWDPRNGGVGCEGHHRRLDGHNTPSLVVPAPELPAHVHEFAADWSLEGPLEDRFPALLT